MQSTPASRHPRKAFAIGAFYLFLVLQLPCQAVSVGAIGTADVYFSPKGSATAAVILALEGAHQQILVQAYSFTSAPIAQALVAAHKRGVQVLVVLDKSNITGKYSAATFLANAGIETRIDAKHSIAHNKVIVIDNATVITGSFNFTQAAECCNAENLLILRQGAALAQAYAANIQVHAAHATPYARRP